MMMVCEETLGALLNATSPESPLCLDLLNATTSFLFRFLLVILLFRSIFAS